MARPRRETKLSAREIGALAMLSYGRVTIAEAARLLGCHRTALTRLCATLEIDAPRARAAYLRSVDLKLDGVGRRPMTKHQLSLRGARALSAVVKPHLITADTPPDTK